MDETKLRAWWSHRQGLDGSLAGESPAAVLERAGWARSVGGVGPYLTLFARAGTSREAADAAAKQVQIHELPSARRCTYVVPARDFALGLQVGQANIDAELRIGMTLGVTEKEIDALGTAVTKALAGGPLDPESIREATGKASRSLGEAGKKKGLTTTLPIALGRLQSAGAIRRVPVNGRLDQQRYAYVLWKPNPLLKNMRTTADAHTELARRYFGWVGPATMAEFQWFSGLGVKAAKETVAPLGLMAVEPGHDRFLLPEDVNAFRAFTAPKKPHYVLVSSLDSISAARRDVRSLLDAKDVSRPVQLEKKVGTIGGLSDLPNHAIFDRGRLVGLWEYDGETESIAWTSFVPKDKALEAAVTTMEAFVREQLGDARSFSLDSPKSRAPKIAALRRA